MQTTWTSEQLEAIERREGDLLLTASAGSGKTSVLVERFVRAVLEDGVEVSAILTITFTEKAAAEMRDRIRLALRERGAEEAAKATESAFISTIHGFCARLLRAHALSAGIDPMFVVLDEPEAGRLADAAFDDALEDLADNAPGGIDLMAAYGPGGLRGAILGVYGELRSRGQADPGLPPLGRAPDLEAARQEALAAAAAAAQELSEVADPSVRVVQALERLGRVSEVLEEAVPWPGDLDRICLPGGNGAALTTPICAAYAEALGRFRAACEHRRAEVTIALLDRLLRSFGERYRERKRAASGVDFEDLELMTRALLQGDGDVRARYQARFERIMVDELQDTNQVQLELIDSIARENLFMVGDAQQSIYAFRHADVELFERRAQALSEVGACATLRTNFRSRREILDVLNRAFARELGERFVPLVAGRDDPPADAPLVELLVADKGADWASEGLASPWRVAEARALAQRIAELIDGGARARDIVVLTRATTDLRTFERALEERGVPTYVIGGRGYWSHPQVLDLVCYLRALANPRDEEALYTVLASPLVGVSADALVVLAAAARASGRDPWWVLREPEGRLDELAAGDRERMAGFARWFGGERAHAGRLSVEQLIERALEHTGYDLRVLSMPGGRRRLANVRKLMRLAGEHEATAGRDVRGFLEAARARASEWGRASAQESEAPVEGEALDAVRLMTIHRAKGLEFEIVCVADLGRGPRWRSDILRVGRDGRVGLRLAEPGTGKRESSLEYKALGEEQQEAQAREERRLFYVAMTRARERLIVSGAAKLDNWAAEAGPIAWVAPALVSDLAERSEEGVGVESRVSEEGVRLSIVRPDDIPVAPREPVSLASLAACEVPAVAPAAAPVAPPTVSALSYSSLGEYRRCGYRFYVERVLGLPPVKRRGWAGAGASAGLGAAERGVLVHALLERLDFRRPIDPSDDMIAWACAREGLEVPGQAQAEEIRALVRAFAQSETCARLGRATGVRREERFRFLLAGVLVTGALDVLAREPDRMLVVDYKSDHLESLAPAEIVASQYLVQRLVYALALLRAGAERVEVVHVFLERPDEPVSAAFSLEDVPRLEAELSGLAAGVLRGEYVVTDTPHREVCDGCPAEGGLCSWPLEMTRREAADRLF